MRRNKNKQKWFVLFCVLLVIFTCIILVQKSKQDAAYGKIKLEFTKVKTSYEVNTKIDGYSFIKKTNAESVDVPKINSEAVGERSFIYLAFDADGNQREFGLILKFVDPIIPILTLTQYEVSVFEGEEFNAKKYVLDAYDPIDGKLKISITQPKNPKIGVHEIVYEVRDKNKNKVSAILRLTVSAKQEEVPTPEPKRNDVYVPSSGVPPAVEIPPQANRYLPPAKFMFSAGYTMPGGSNPSSSACMMYKGTNWGSCNPIVDADGFTFLGTEYVPY